GIRDRTVTGVQTCALPISPLELGSLDHCFSDAEDISLSEPSLLLLCGASGGPMSPFINLNMVMSSSVMGGWLVKCPYLLAKVERSEERRVGKGFRCQDVLC